MTKKGHQRARSHSETRPELSGAFQRPRSRAQAPPEPQFSFPPSEPATHSRLDSIINCLQTLTDGIKQLNGLKSKTEYIKAMEQYIDLFLAELRKRDTDEDSAFVPRALNPIFSFRGFTDAFQGKGPIYNIGITFSKRPDKLPPGWEILTKTVTGKYTADVGSGGKSAYICVSREVPKKKIDGQVPLPLTSTSVILRDVGEEAPFGFTIVQNSMQGSSFPANLNASTQQGHRIYLCHCRGDMCPIMDIGILAKGKGEECPPGYNEVLTTPFGADASLNQPNNPEGKKRNPNCIRLVFASDVSKLIRPFMQFMQSPSASAIHSSQQGGRKKPSPAAQKFLPDAPIAIVAGSALKVSPSVASFPRLQGPSGSGAMRSAPWVDADMATTLALLTGCLGCHNEFIVTHALDCFMKLPLNEIPPRMLECFLQAVCAAAPLFTTFFTTGSHTWLLHFLYYVIRRCWRWLTLHSMINIAKVCFLTRHEDKRSGVSRRIIDFLINKVKDELAFGDPGAAPSPSPGTSAAASIGPEMEGSLASQAVPAASTVAVAPSPASMETTGENPVSGDDGEEDPTKIVRPIVTSIASSIISVKRLEFDLDRLHGFSTTDPDLVALTISLVKQMSPPVGPGCGPASRMLLAWCIVCCKFAADQSGSLLINQGASAEVRRGLHGQSETVKRKQHGLVLLGRMLQNASDFFRGMKGTHILLQRVVCPTLVQSCFTNDKDVFAHVLRNFNFLWRLYQDIVGNELAIFISRAFLPLLRTNHYPVALRKGIVDLFLYEIMRTPDAVVNLYYNYDNRIGQPPLFDRLCSALVAVVEGDLLDTGVAPNQTLQPDTSDASPQDAVSADEKGTRVVASAEEPTRGGGSELVQFMSDEGPANTYSSQHTNVHWHSNNSVGELRQNALRLIAVLLKHMSTVIGVPGVRPMPDPRTPEDAFYDAELEAELQASGSRLTQSEVFGRELLKQIRQTHDLNSRLSGADQPVWTQERLARCGSWVDRYNLIKDQNRRHLRAAFLAKTHGLKKGLQYLHQESPSTLAPERLAAWLFESEGLDKREVGDLLGALDMPPLLNEQQCAMLRSAYVRRIDFTGMDLLTALRFFVGSCDFYLPGEAQKIDRLLESFSVGYCEDNPDVFQNPERTYVLVYALVMCNTSVHNRSLKAAQRMTEPQFLSMLRGEGGVDEHGNKTDFDHDVLIAFFNSISEREFTMSPDKEERREADAEEQGIEYQEAASRHVRSILRHTCGLMKRNHAPARLPSVARSRHMVRAMYETCAFKVLTAINFAVDQMQVRALGAAASLGGAVPGTSDSVTSAPGSGVLGWPSHQGSSKENERIERVLHICLDGLAYGCVIGIIQSFTKEFQAFASSLAKLSWIQENVGVTPLETFRQSLQRNEWLKQDWHRRLNLQSQKEPQHACRNVLKVALEAKQKTTFEKNQAIMREVQDLFVNDYILVDPPRTYIRSGPLQKLSASRKGRKETYYFFLFSDIILYATTSARRYKVHRVVHLSLLRIVDLRCEGAHAFKLVNPQKSVLVLASSTSEKREWMEAIAAAAQKIFHARRKFVLSASQSQSPPASAPASQRLLHHSVSMGNLVDIIKDAQQQPLSPASDQRSLNSANSTSGSGIGERQDSLGSVGGGSDEDDWEVLRRMSTFIGRNSSSDGSERGRKGSAGQLKQRNFCRLCLRAFTTFRRRNACNMCHEHICGDCSARKKSIPDGKNRKPRRVCDACYGLLSGLVGDNIPFITAAEWDKQTV